MNQKIILIALAMVGAAMASQSYHQPTYYGTHNTPYSFYSESQSYNQPSYKSIHGASYYNEPITIEGKNYHLDLDSNKNNDYTFVTLSDEDQPDIEKKIKEDIYVKYSQNYNKYHMEDHHESSYHQIDDKLHYGSSSSYHRPSYQKQGPITYNVHKEEPSYHTTHKQETSYMVPSYHTTHKQEPSYMVHKEEPSYKMQSYKQETPYYKTYQEPTHYKDSNRKHSTHKEMTSGYGVQYQYKDNGNDHDLYRSNYQQASERISNAGIQHYSAKPKTPIIVKVTTMNNNKNVYNKQYDY